MRTLLALLVASLAATAVIAQVYRLQPGDRIEVSIVQDPGLGREVLVGPDGRISFPHVGQLRVAGLTLGAVETALARHLADLYKNGVNVTVLLTSVAEEEMHPTIYVVGEVQKPGAFEVETRTSVLQAIALSGGLSPYAAKRRILVRRNVKGEELVFPFDYAAAEAGRNTFGDFHLRHGDVIVVPERGLLE